MSGCKRTKTLLEKFIEKVRFAPELDGCWVWVGARYTKGYAQMRFGKKQKRGSHISLLLFKRLVVPKGKGACHTCDNPPCVNPDHLYVGNQKQNTADSINRGRYKFCHMPRKLTAAKVKEIRSSTELGYVIAKRMGVSPQMVSDIRTWKGWKHVA